MLSTNVYDAPHRPRATHYPTIQENVDQMLAIPQNAIGSTFTASRGVRARVATIAIVLGFAILTGLAAQIRIPLGFTPVPITGSTFAVLLSGVVLGSRAGAASQVVYVILGGMGLPFFAGGTSGWEVVTGSTAGYLVGFIVAAAIVGRMAESKADRKVRTAVPAFLVGSAVIYLFGAIGLMVVLDVGAAESIRLGVSPFIAGDIAKAVLAGLLLPAAWNLVRRLQG